VPVEEVGCDGFDVDLVLDGVDDLIDQERLEGGVFGEGARVATNREVSVTSAFVQNATTETGASRAPNAISNTAKNARILPRDRVRGGAASAPESTWPRRRAFSAVKRAISSSGFSVRFIAALSRFPDASSCHYLRGCGSSQGPSRGDGRPRLRVPARVIRHA
jgi:hypothetical protein